MTVDEAIAALERVEEELLVQADTFRRHAQSLVSRAQAAEDGAATARELARAAQGDDPQAKRRAVAWVTELRQHKATAWRTR